MTFNQPPNQHPVIDKETGKASRTWALWFTDIFREKEAGFSGSWVNNEGDTVTVVDGRITDVS